MKAIKQFPGAALALGQKITRRFAGLFQQVFPQALERRFVKEWGAVLAKDAKIYTGMYTSLVRVAKGESKKPEKTLREWVSRTAYQWEDSLISELCRRTLTPAAESGSAEECARWAQQLLHAARQAGITRDNEEAVFTLDEHSILAYEEWDGQEIYPDDTVKVMIPAWYQEGRVLEQGQCILIAEEDIADKNDEKLISSEKCEDKDMEEPKKKPLEEMTVEERREMIVNNIIKIIADKQPDFPAAIKCDIPGMPYEVKIGVNRMFGEYYFMIGVGKKDEIRKVYCYLKSGSRKEILEYMQQRETREEALRVMYQLLDRIEESMETLKSGMSGAEKLQFCISKVRQAFISRLPNIEFGMIFPIPDTKNDATMWVGKREAGRYYFQVSVENTDNDMLVSNFLIFGNREEIMEFVQQEEMEKKVFEQIVELSQRVDK